MRIYTYSEARQNLAALLDEARRYGSVRIRRRDGQTFVLQPEVTSDSPLEVPPVALGLNRTEILDLIREGRRS